MLPDYHTDITAYIRREINLEELVRRLGSALTVPGVSAELLLTAVDDIHRSGQIKKSDHALLRHEIMLLLPENNGTPANSVAAMDDLAASATTGVFTSSNDGVTGHTRVKPRELPESTRIHGHPPQNDYSGDDSIRNSNHTTTQAVGPGSIIKNRFVLENIIAQGGMGIVYKARDLRKEEARDRNPYVAVKVLTEDFKSHPDALITLQREAKKAQSLAHPNVVTVYDFDRDGATIFMTMELLEGESMDKMLRKTNYKGMDFRQAWPLIEGMGQALSYAHSRGIVHSDFKPGNVFITREGIVKVLDFGIARAIKQPGEDRDTTVFDAGSLGALSPGYASCEMFERMEPDPRDDIYGLACVSYELLTGQHPFDWKTSVEARSHHLVAGISGNLNRTQWKALQRGLAFHREDRTPSIDRFLAELKPNKARKLGISIFVVLLVAGIVYGGYYGYEYWQEQKVDQRFLELERLLEKDPLESTDISEAATRLDKLTKLAPGDIRIQQASVMIALAYLNRAREAQASENWEAARQLLGNARQIQAGQSIDDTLDSESAAIEAAEQAARTRDEKIVQEKVLQAGISRLQDQFEGALKTISPTPEAAGSALAILKEISALDPANPYVTEGRSRIAEKLSAAAMELGDQEQLEEGLELAEQSLRLLPESESLSSSRDHLEKAIEERLAARIEEHKNKVQQLISEPTFTPDWNQAVNAEMMALHRLLPPDDPWLITTDNTLASLYQKHQDQIKKRMVQKKTPPKKTQPSQPVSQRDNQPPISDPEYQMKMRKILDGFKQ